MTNIRHIEHPEDTILCGDLDILGWFQSPGRLSVKIDGAPAIVWGRCPVSGMQFVGTKSVFNKRESKICYSRSDIEHYYGHIPVLVEILDMCLECLPDTPYIYQGDWIGFGGEREYTPNTLTYLFPDYTGEDVIIAPHTRYELGENGLRDAYGVPINRTELKSTELVRFVQPKCRMYTGYYNAIEGRDSHFELGNRVEFARQIAASVEFVDKKTAAKLKKAFNKAIRNGEDIHPDTVECEGVDRTLIRVGSLVRCIKLAALYQCRHDYSLEVYFQGDEAEHEGYVFDNGFGTYKLVDRMTFSRRNFLHSRMARG